MTLTEWVARSVKPGCVKTCSAICQVAWPLLPDEMICSAKWRIASREKAKFEEEKILPSLGKKGRHCQLVGCLGETERWPAPLLDEICSTKWRIALPIPIPGKRHNLLWLKIALPFLEGPTHWSGDWVKLKVGEGCSPSGLARSHLQCPRFAPCNNPNDYMQIDMVKNVWSSTIFLPVLKVTKLNWF